MHGLFKPIHIPLEGGKDLCDFFLKRLILKIRAPSMLMLALLFQFWYIFP